MLGRGTEGYGREARRNHTLGAVPCCSRTIKPTALPQIEVVI